MPFKIAYAMPGETIWSERHGTNLKILIPSSAFRFFGRRTFRAVLIGEKPAAAFTPHDLQLLTSLVKNLSLHLNQIRLKNQILLSQEMDLLGLMSRGMAHDLNNLMTPIWTYLQLVREEAMPGTARLNCCPSSP